MVAKRARLFRATGRVVPGIKIKHNVFAFEIGERNPSAAVDGRSELGRFVPFLQF